MRGEKIAQAKAAQITHGFRDYAFIDAGQMKSPHRGIKRQIRKAPPRRVQHIHNAGVGAGGKHDQPLAAQMHRHEAFIRQPFIRLPWRIVILARYLAGQARLVSGGAGDFATYIETIGNDVFIAHHNGCGTHRRPGFWLGDWVHRKKPAIGLSARAFAEHAGMQIKRHGLPAIGRTRHFNCLGQAPRMIPMSVR